MKTVDKPYLYIATSLAHVPEPLRPRIAELVKYLEVKTHLLEWAFDPEAWVSRKVDNIFAFDTTMLGLADFVAAVFWSSAGSDGRGAEIYARVQKTGNKGLVIYMQKGVYVSPFIIDMTKFFGVTLRTFSTVSELGLLIVEDAFRSLRDELWPIGQYSRSEAIEALCSGRLEDLASSEAVSDLKRLIGEGESKKTTEESLV